MKALKLSMALAILGGLSSCEEDGYGLNEQEQELVDHFLEAEKISTRLYNMSDELMRAEELDNKDTITFRQALAYREGNDLVVDFGKGSYDENGIQRSGILRVQPSGNYLQRNGSLTVSLEEYQEEKTALSGSLQIESRADSIRVTTNDLELDTVVLVQTAKRIHWLQGFESRSDKSDDQFLLYGISSVEKGDLSLKASIDPAEELHYDRSCEFGMMAGVLDFDLQADSLSSSGAIDFLSDDGCENVLELTIEKNGSAITTVRSFNGF